MRLDELVNNHIEPGHHSKATQKCYQTALNILKKDNPSIETTKEVTETLLRQWKIIVLSRSSESTWNNYHRHLKTLFSSAFKTEGIQDENPFSLVRRIASPIEKDKVVTISDINYTIAVVNEYSSSFSPAWFWENIIRFLYYTGVRRRQIVGLKWGDIKYDQHAILLSAQHSKTKKQWYIPITEPIDLILRNQYQRTAKVLKRQPLPHEQLFNITIFTNGYSGSVLKGESISGFFRRLKKHGSNLSAHKLRHTMATVLCNIDGTENASISLKSLQSQLGHSTINTTAQYIRPSLSSQAKMLNQLKEIN